MHVCHGRDYWARFEAFLKQLTRRARDVYVVTGPLWLPTQDADGGWKVTYPFIGRQPGTLCAP